MTRRSKLSEAPWSEWTDRDDRSWLAELGRENWSAAYCRESLHSVLPFIVTSLSYASHTRFGTRPSKDALSAHENAFLEWMGNRDAWQSLEKIWRNDKEGPWSLPIALSRYYWRYSRAQDPQRELTELEREIGFDPSSIFVAAFDELVTHLPHADARLMYQLHLDGLLPDEIAALLQRDPMDVRGILEMAKRHVASIFQERAYGS